jgi:voltage-dependent anion channel protein 2
MGKGATIFKDLGKTCSDLLSKDYKVGKTSVEVKTTQQGVTLTPTVNLNETTSGSLKAKYNFLPWVSTEVVLDTSGKTDVTIEAQDVLTGGLTLSAECKLGGASGMLSSANLIADYKADSVTCKTSFDPLKNDFSAASTFAISDLTLGGSVDYCTRMRSVQKYGVACQFVQPDFTVAASCKDSKGAKSVAASYYHNVSRDMQLGVALERALGKKKDVNIEFGCAYKLDKDTSCKAKVDSNGFLSASYKQQISNLTQLTLCTSVDTVNLSNSKPKLGLALNITP